MLKIRDFQTHRRYPLFRLTSEKRKKGEKLSKHKKTT